MKLILHIGSHKTASTSIQHFCSLNRALLLSHGYYYPKNKGSAYVFNFLAAHLAFNRGDQAKEFIHQSIIKAKESGAHTVVISAESFFAMTAIFLDLYDRQRQKDNYWDNERALIESLYAYCNDFNEIDVCCYLRPQQDLAFSLYNQFVKNVRGISESYQDFIAKIKPALDYQGHIQIWCDIFGRENIKVRSFLSCKKDPVTDFVSTFLKSQILENAETSTFFANTRLNRDVLEYKRIYNAQKPDRSHAFVCSKFFKILSEKFPDKKGYQIFSEPEDQKAFFEQFIVGNNKIVTQYGLKDLSNDSEFDEMTYLGLSKEKRIEIDKEFNKLLNKPLNRAEIALRRVFNFIKDNLPGGKSVISLLQMMNNEMRLRISRK